MMGQNQTNLRAKINVFLTGSQFDYIIVIINLSSLNQYISQLICKLPFTFSHLVCMSMTNYKAYIYIYIDIHYYSLKETFQTMEPEHPRLGKLYESTQNSP